MKPQIIDTVGYWQDVRDKLLSRERLLGQGKWNRAAGGRKLLETERLALLGLIRKAEEQDISLAEIAESRQCSTQNVYQFFTGQHGVNLEKLITYGKLLGVGFEINMVPLAEKICR